jgi:hypothetical protein
MEVTLSIRNKIIGWILAGLIAALMVFSGSAKLLMPEMATNFEQWGLGDWRVIIAIGELVSVLLFLFPRTHRVGLLLMSAYLGGAIMVHMMKGESFVVPAVVLVLVWVTGVVRNTSW